ncbi:hypothetical protein P175DRAFT_0497744 [Aspergillus ochraceoroseus IBT 24754]|uniref:BZIP domain-containing protein n=3 Tax=Aspergillus subgen. Nidulantes TaxID=2720870 RepID=A0A0F8U100_9EURO|nr:uncharacterized protein P175DRAFT_0497744 [Aspergillus ochraceoroseus IBT 24754]KKK13228.1 hypothetical protein ARAM_000551 [Aspergillus rambellii]KKK14102.1 hypothetical protein AOCH_000887 [Aspergillus ochraceoroseus]PTU24637.1 hypothetical protein P175DRAFT_0497744 [Aspergillus ochraceoroseus IBT 24754]
MSQTTSQMLPDAMGSGSKMPLYSWDQPVSRAPLSPRVRPAQMANFWATPQLTSLLSATSYPVPEPVHSQDHLPPADQEPVPLLGGVVIDSSSSGIVDDDLLSHHEEDSRASVSPDTSHSDQSQTAAHRPSKRQRMSNPNGEAVRKRGRPRKPIDGAKGEDPEERRRMQVRMAQRAYRSRKEASISSLKSRITHLETTVERMNTAVLSFGDELVHSGALESHPDLLQPLRDTVQKCLVMPTAGTGSGSAAHTQDSNTTMPSSAALHYLLPPSDPGAGHSPPFGFTTTGPNDANWSIYRSPSFSSSSEIVDTMEIPDFIDQLHVACRYQAYLLAANTSVPMRRIEAPFRMLLSIMPRASITAYFKDWLLARANNKPLTQWDHVPYFCVGGAGTHYHLGSETSYSPKRPALPHQTWSSEPEPLSRFPTDIQEDLDEDWFDLQDLEGFLRAKHVTLPTCPPSDIKIGPLERGPLANTAANVTRLIQSLISRAMCLGRSPGFRRKDVESALADFRNASLSIMSF